jgi:hypothetical protein
MAFVFAPEVLRLALSLVPEYLRTNEKLMQAINQTGEAYFSHTKLSGRFSLRLVVSQLRTNDAHVARVWEVVQEQLHFLKDRFVYQPDHDP